MVSTDCDSVVGNGHGGGQGFSDIGDDSSDQKSRDYEEDEGDAHGGGRGFSDIGDDSSDQKSRDYEEDEGDADHSPTPTSKEEQEVGGARRSEDQTHVLLLLADK